MAAAMLQQPMAGKAGGAAVACPLPLLCWLRRWLQPLVGIGKTGIGTALAAGIGIGTGTGRATGMLVGTPAMLPVVPALPLSTHATATNSATVTPMH